MRIPLTAVLLALAAVAWVISARLMSGMDAGPGTDPGAFGLYLGTWVAMMAAMMLPALVPKVLSHVEPQRQPKRAGRSAEIIGTALFLIGYLSVWTLAGLAAYGVLEGGRALDGGSLAWARAGRWVAAGVLLAVCVYQLSPAKDACLRRCREHRAVAAVERGAGRSPGLRSGMRDALWCLGCCWGLMAALFALGAMSLAWMALVAALIACERLLPWRKLAAGAVAAVLAALTIGLAAAPSQLPGLTIPGGSSARMTGMPAADRMPAQGARMQPR